MGIFKNFIIFLNKNMKIICAGYPKTGSKSCSGALRVLGFKVADWLETAEFLGSTWRDFIDEKIEIEEVLKKYDELGFDANQDLPGNFLWEELYLASSKDTKVILTVRDSDEQWWKSWCGFMTQEFSRHSIGDFCVAGLLNIIAKKGYMGKEMNAIMEVDNRISRNWLGMPEFAETFYSVKSALKALTSGENRMRQLYKKHNLYVQHV